MATTSDPDVTVPDRRLRLALLDRTGSDRRFTELVDQALTEALTSAADLPQVLYLALLRAGLEGAPPPRPLPFAPEGAPAPADEQETCLREIRARWGTHTRRHLFPTPAAWLRALLPAAPLAGNPYSLARLLRVFAGHLAPSDCGAAASLAALIEDPGEAAVAQCALVGAGLAAHDLDREAQSWARQRHLLTRMPSWSWPGGRADHDSDAVAYLRPDHRARFDTAIGMLPFSAALGFALLTDLPELAAAHQGAYACHGSAVYTEQRLRGRRPDPEAAAVHDEVRRDPAAAGAVVVAVVSANEQVLGGAELPVGDPVYRLSARITARTTRAHRLGADDLTPEPVPDGFDPRRLPAYAEIVRQNADTPIVAALAARVRAEASARDDREALLILADAGYTDPDPLLDGPDPLRGGRKRSSREKPDHHQDSNDHSRPQKRQTKPPRRYEKTPPPPELSILLFRHRPAEAVRRLAAAARTDWPTAAAMLEHAAPEILATAGPRIAHALHEAVVQAATCTAPPGATPPPVVDGTYPDATPPWTTPPTDAPPPEPRT
ncbi:hypothetical protein [Actinoplanes sp. NPDC026670]|uniref:hypothetical protein n=1 Tax=Actinoplanes sp. NPDC026670 TaxID=3154700 RepID=UPI0033D45C35